MDLRQLTTSVVEDAFGMWRYRWLAIGTAWAIAILGWLWVLSLPNQYDATARVYVDTETTLRPLMKGLTVNKDTLSDVALVTQALLSQPQLKAVAVETGLESRAKTPEELERLLDSLRRRISITKMAKQDIFSIEYRDSSPEMARNVVQVLLTNFMESSLRKDRTDSAQAQTFLQQQIKLYETRLEEAENRLADFKKQNVGVMPGEGGDYYTRLQTAQAELRGAQAELQAAESRRAELMRQVEGEEPVLGMSALGSGMSNTSSVDGPIADMEAQLSELRVQFTDKHPDVLRIKQTLDDLYKIREQEREKAAAAGINRGAGVLDRNPVYQQMRVALSTTDAEIASLRAQVGQRADSVGYLKRMVDTIPEVEAQLNRLNRDYDVVKNQYDALVRRLESARLSDEVQADNEQVTFDVIEPPRLPLFPAAPDRLLLFSGVMVAALVGGLGLAFFLNLHSPVFFSAQKLRQTTGLPVFGVVGRTGQTTHSREDLAFGVAVSVLVLAFVILMSIGTGGFQPGGA